jgi:hypothetical protein
MFGQLLPNKNKIATVLHNIYCAPTLVSKQGLGWMPKFGLAALPFSHASSFC